ncbi:LexA repressor [Acaryochloris thomasi RCC1774]|uniref:LexA repressor n=1 Tax=Acaryochloris thomasi RCC1774 TaxID=1764569 RepID=A0A2W1JFJ8_9CYAN|nr:VCBS repeat-containing protein [Acaryochloris thomasi]PZD70465.1 LexA repressor [Acaryochloris thomasi RCC1774]
MRSITQINTFAISFILFYSCHQIIYAQDKNPINLIYPSNSIYRSVQKRSNDLKITNEKGILIKAQAKKTGIIFANLSQGSEFSSSRMQLTDIPFYGLHGTYFADATGDGRADAIVVNDDKVTVRRSDGSNFTSNEAWTSNPYYGSRGTYFADVTGDGRADAIVVNDDKVTVRRSDGSNFTSNEAWTSNPYYGSRGTYFADVTGDGRADAIVVNDDKVTVRRSDGSNFTSNEAWTSNPYYGSLGTYFADVTGDGRADAIVVNADKVTVRRSDGSKFIGNEVWATNRDFPLHRSITFADINADKLSDFLDYQSGPILY